MHDQISQAPASTAQKHASTSLSLLERVRGEDPEAWRRFVHLYSPLVYSWVRRATLDTEDVADVLQEVWHAVAANVGRLEHSPGKGALRAWLWTVTRNKIRDLFRARQHRPEAVGGSDIQERLLNLPEPPSDTESNDGEFLWRALELIRGDFEERTWQAFWRTTMEERTATEAAVELGMSADAIYQAKSRVLRRLREELSGLID